MIALTKTQFAALEAEIAKRLDLSPDERALPVLLDEDGAYLVDDESGPCVEWGLRERYKAKARAAKGPDEARTLAERAKGNGKK